MQRLDENTYIDDTLVNCVEYQLFVDEMLEQGRYCQPSQWKSHHFPKGHALTPILGVSYFHAKAFCEWLTQRDIGSWSYRLPTTVEAKESFMKSTLSSLSLGYWIMERDERCQFTWIGDIPGNSRHLTNFTIDLKGNRDKTIALALRLTSDLDQARDRIFEQAHYITQSLADNLKIDLGRDLNFDLDQDIYNARTVANDIATSRIMTSAGIRARNLAYTLTSIIDLIFAINHAYDISQSVTNSVNVDIVFDLARALALARDLAPDRETANVIDHDLDIASIIVVSHVLLIASKRDLDINFFSSHEVSNAIYRARSRALNPISDSSFEDANSPIDFLDLCIDAVTLFKRIAGSSPAFEGIRLVKERIK